MMLDQENLYLHADEKIEIDKFQFEPIKGYPMLNWKGKRPFRSTQYYPAQKKEEYGESVNDWLNKLFWGDNLQVMSHLLKDYRGKVDLIYIDPPFDSKADYKKAIKMKGKNILNDSSSFEEKQYKDIWTNDEYLQFMYERIMLMRELLVEGGSIYVHCDWHVSHYIRLILDEIFGTGSFQNEIIWSYSGWNRENNSYFNRRHDTVFYYTKGKCAYFVPYKLQWESKEAYVKQRKQKLHIDESGKEYVLSDGGNGSRVKRYIEEALLDGRPIDDVWEIDKLNNSDKDKTDYPTQKPEYLLERIISSSCPPNGIVFDCFMGSGTTQAVAMKLDRQFIGADINFGAVQTTTKRLLNLINQYQGEGEKIAGFEVYNVNHYDIFRNPVEARDLLVEALEIHKYPEGSVYDGEKDGRMVKIMPVNRITTKADLNSLISNFDYSKWEKLQAQAPSQVVENILLVCMGHEPDLQSHLEMEVAPFKIDVQVVDILKDKSNLEFKRDAEAHLEVNEGTLSITKFYPMNLLQKLSIQQEEVKDWKELVESIMIDWNYDGAILHPSELDIPEKNDLVSGEYKIPADAGTIRVKITDLLSESWEGEVEYE